MSSIYNPQQVGGTGVSSLNSLTGALTLGATGPITLTVVGNTLTIGSPTSVTSAASLTNNAVVLGAGGQGEKTTTSFTTDGVSTLTIGVAGSGNGVLALAGNITGTAIFTAPATAGISTNPVAMSNVLLGPAGTAASPTFQVGPGLGIFETIGAGLGLAAGGSELAVLNPSGDFGSTGFTYIGGLPGAGVALIASNQGAPLTVSGVVPVMFLFAINSGQLGVAIDGSGNLGVAGMAVAASFGVNDGSQFISNLLISGMAPTISSGFGTGPSVSSNNGTASFRINVGTGGTAQTGVIGLPAAKNGWNCFALDITTQNSTVARTQQIGPGNTTTVTIGNFTDLGVAGAWASGDTLIVSCFAF